MFGLNLHRPPFVVIHDTLGALEGYSDNLGVSKIKSQSLNSEQYVILPLGNFIANLIDTH